VGSEVWFKSSGSGLGLGLGLGLGFSAQVQGLVLWIGELEGLTGEWAYPLTRMLSLNLSAPLTLTLIATDSIISNPSPNPNPNPHGHTGEWVGVELFEPWDDAASKFRGKTDGTWWSKGLTDPIRLFECDQFSGLFVSIDQVFSSTAGMMNDSLSFLPGEASHRIRESSLSDSVCSDRI
jgi:hypothetical protein